MLRKTVLITLLLGLGGSWSMATAQVQSHESIRRAAADHVRAQYDGPKRELKVKVDQLDSRLRLSQCDSALETCAPPGRSLPSKQTIGVRCSAGQPWSLYVPVNVSIMKNILVASRELPRGSMVDADDLRLEQRDVARLRAGYLEHAQQAVGKIVKRTLHQGDALLPSQILMPEAVKRGGKVIILAKAGPLQVRMAGKALNSGSTGELIEVMNESSQKRVEGIIVAPGVVEVPL